MSSCLICCENFTTGDRSEIHCQWCQFSACSTCCKTYILDQKATVCMNGAKNPDGTHVCRKVWTRKFVMDNFTKNWVEREWKRMNSGVMVEKEKALLPATMAVLENRKEIKVFKNEVNEISKEIAILESRRRALKHQISSGGSVITTKNASIGRKCMGQNCRGFLSSQWKCGLCEKWTCPDCHVIKGHGRDTEHTCDPDTVATVKLLNKDTKPCPSCVTPIHKIEGCDQMWCTQCHTAFSWRRGTIETRIHNPHYYEWQRTQNQGVAPRNPGDFECGRNLADRNTLIFINETLSTESLFKNLTNDDLVVLETLKEKIPKIIRKTIHLEQHDGRKFDTTNPVDNVDLRVKYLLKQITEARFSTGIHTAYKAYEKKQDIRNVLQLQYQGVTDIIYRFADVLKSQVWGDYIDSHLIAKLLLISNEIDELTKYSNELLREHSTTYGCKKYSIRYESGRWAVLY